MKSRHAVALALVGWYLIVPPDFTAPHSVNAGAPISRWRIVTKFDSEAACKQAVSELRNKNGDLTELDPTGKLQRYQKRLPSDPKRAAERAGYATCIATGDPRLRH